jgi:hypothetical protein
MGEAMTAKGLVTVDGGESTMCIEYLWMRGREESIEGIKIFSELNRKFNSIMRTSKQDLELGSTF